MTKSHLRTQNFLSQIKGSFIFKFIAIAIGFFTTPILVQYLGVEKYGIWSVVFGLISWLTIFDFGLGNGLKNEVTKAITIKDNLLLNKLIVTGYITNFLIITAVLFIFLIIASFIDWQQLLNTEAVSKEYLLQFVMLIFSIMSLNFIVSLVLQVIHGYQKSSYTTLFQMLSNIVVFVFLYILNIFNQDHSLIYIAFLYGISLISVNLLGSIWFFKTKTTLTFSPAYFDKSMIKNFMNFGLKFFYLQIAVILIYQTDKIIISNLFGPEEVAHYDLLFKLFSIVITIHTLVLTPLWPAMADAYHNKDKEWIHQTIKKINLFLLPLILIVIFIAYFHSEIIYYWIGSSLQINSQLVLFLAISITFMLWNNNYSYIMNGFGKLNLQLYTATFGMICNIPLSIYLGKYLESSGGVVLASVLLQSIFLWLGPWYVYKQVNKMESK